MHNRRHRAAEKATRAVIRRYNTLAPLYDIVEGFGERGQFRRWRALMWSKVEGQEILEVGVGTGRNFPYYPPGARITAIDFSSSMLNRARRKAARDRISVTLEEMDVQQLSYEDNSFDCVVASLVFCSVPDPVRGLREVGRVCRPGGKVVLLEHTLSSRKVLARLMNVFNPMVCWLLGDNINRRTVENVAASGLELEKITRLGDIFKLIEARKPL